MSLVRTLGNYSQDENGLGEFFGDFEEIPEPTLIARSGCFTLREELGCYWLYKVNEANQASLVGSYSLQELMDLGELVTRATLEIANFVDNYQKESTLIPDRKTTHDNHPRNTPPQGAIPALQ